MLAREILFIFALRKLFKSKYTQLSKVHMFEIQAAYFIVFKVNI